jgi:hypothetical protein
MQCIQLGADLVEQLQRDCRRVQRDIDGKENCTCLSKIQGHQRNHVLGSNYVEIRNRKSSWGFQWHNVHEKRRHLLVHSSPLRLSDSDRKTLKCKLQMV